MLWKYHAKKWLTKLYRYDLNIDMQRNKNTIGATILTTTPGKYSTTLQVNYQTKSRS